MKNIVQLIREHKFVEAEDQIDNAIPLIMEKKLFEMKKAIAAKMCEQMKSASKKIRLDIMEDDLEEMDVSKEKPEMDDVEDTRKESGVNSSIKTNLGGEQEVASGKGNLPKKQTVNDAEKGDLKKEELEEKKGLWDNIHAKRKRIKRGSGERMRKPGSEGAPSEKDLKNSQTEEVLKEEELDEARISIVRARVRGGKIQRRKKVSNVPGMTLRGGTLKRMSAAERRRRKMGARKGKAKRRAKLSRSLMKRKRSLQKRKSLGL